MNMTIPVTTDERWPDEGRKAFAWVEERRRNAPGLDSLLRWAHGLGASRIDIKTGHPVTIKVHGVIRYATCKATDSLALADIVGHVYASDGMAMLGVGHILDTAYSVALDRKVNLRFRINLSPISVKRGSGVHIVMRPVPARPASLDQQMVEQEIRDTNRLKSGMVLFGGATGSGKTTLQFGLAIEKLMDPTVYCDMATGEEPIEFLLDDLRPPSGSRISQTEIRPPTLTFPTFTRSLTRREMSDGIITECRDGETMNAAINIAMMGGILGTTLHAVKRHGKVTPSEGGQAAKNDPFLRNGFTMAFMLNGGPVWDACCGNNWKDPSRAFCRRKGDQGDLPGPWDIAADGTQGDPVGTDVF
ncbi:ATPase, T2SS/T4P/T4SS family [Komagataeibacter oboediens]|uniref:ATPase, T2SS/T4P/T4SS family n=1 Tax=Komagataeibacter oboediens TaxID=65958 RepID=UPI000237E1C7|nr:ATPase, T2SS/T4P/T4SS family [Komagataeibacter oboediens]